MLMSSRFMERKPDHDKWTYRLRGSRVMAIASANADACSTAAPAVASASNGFRLSPHFNMWRLTPDRQQRRGGWQVPQILTQSCAYHRAGTGPARH
jgi:hypothetical protein